MAAEVANILDIGFTKRALHGGSLLINTVITRNYRRTGWSDDYIPRTYTCQYLVLLTLYIDGIRGRFYSVPAGNIEILIDQV